MRTYLEERLQWYDDNYREGNALISDAQFDQLEQNLQRIDPKCDYFNKKNNLISKSNYKITNEKNVFLIQDDCLNIDCHHFIHE